MPYLSVKLDHVAVLRQARKLRAPDPSHAAVAAELAGADGIAVHLRRDRRHIRERDLYILKQIVRTRLTVEVAPVEEFVTLLLDARPYMVVFVPEADRELTTQAGLNLADDFAALETMSHRLKEVGVKTAFHIEPDTEVIKHAARLGADAVKLHTGMYVDARTEAEGLAELERLERAGKAAAKANLLVLAGQGLDYHNLSPVARLGVIDEFIIGQSIVAQAVLVGMHEAVARMLACIRRESRPPG